VAVGSPLPAASAANLLHVVLNALGHVEVDHTLQVLEIQAHSQGNSGDHYLDGPLPKLLECFRLLLVGKRGMVDGGLGRDRVSDVVEHFSHDPPGASVHQDALALADQRIVEITDQRLILQLSLLSADSHEQILVHAAR
jgi:hypothetical protein